MPCATSPFARSIASVLIVLGGFQQIAVWRNGLGGGRARAGISERHRVLRVLEKAPNGCTEALMLAHGFTSELFDRLVVEGVVTFDRPACVRGVGGSRRHGSR